MCVVCVLCVFGGGGGGGVYFSRYCHIIFTCNQQKTAFDTILKFICGPDGKTSEYTHTHPPPPTKIN